ncbi:MAG TPA: hypothetical protein VF669_04465 [Tepidisphaeraceae bacterium]
MKAERRHELQQNALAKVIVGAPTWWQQYGGRALLFAIAFLAIALLINYRVSSTRASTARANEALATARADINQLMNSAAASQAPPAQLATQRKGLFNEASTFIEESLRLAPTDTIAAESLVAKGDLNWTLAMLPELPGAATQPSLQLTRDPQELIRNASEAYQQVLNKHAGELHAAIAARFGLAAIAENKGEWDAAKSQYEQVTTTANVPQSYLGVAKMRLDRLPELRQQPLLKEPATMPAMPVIPLGIAAPVNVPGAASAPANGAATAPAMVMSATRSAATAPVPPVTQPAPVKSPTSAPKAAPATGVGK